MVLALLAFFILMGAFTGRLTRWSLACLLLGITVIVLWERVTF